MTSAPAHVDTQWWGSLADLRSLLDRGFVSEYRQPPPGDALYMDCLLCPDHSVTAVEPRADHAEFWCDHGCDEAAIRVRLFDAQQTADAPLDLDLEEGSIEARMREAGVLEDGHAFYASKGPAAAGFLVDGLWAEGGVGWIAGEPKTLKTWLICELIITITTGRPAFGEFACERPGRVLYVAEEGNRRRFQERLAGLCNAYGVSLERVKANLDVVWRQHVDLLDESWKRDLEAIAPGYRAIFLDPFRDMHDANEDRVDEVKPVLDFLRRLQEQGPAVAAVMHLRKARDGDNKVRAGQRVAGSRHFHSFLDSALYLDREKAEEDGSVKVTVEHRDEEAIDPFTIDLEVEGTADAPDFRLRAETAEGALRGRTLELRAKAVEAARERGPSTKTSLASALGIQRKVALKVIDDCSSAAISSAIRTRRFSRPRNRSRRFPMARNRSEPSPSRRPTTGNRDRHDAVPGYSEPFGTDLPCAHRGRRGSRRFPPTGGRNRGNRPSADPADVPDVRW